MTNIPDQTVNPDEVPATDGTATPDGTALASGSTRWRRTTPDGTATPDRTATPDGTATPDHTVVDDIRPSFVLHDHRMPRPHFDLRLEENGVLRSWAVPRGLPTRSTENRLAIAVPDHDLEHLRYTDANKFIADIGWWTEDDRTDKRILFTLHGRDGSRRYALINTGRDWLLHLTKEQPD